MISPEWVATVATGIPVYASAGLVVWGQGYLWRRTLWDEHGPALRELERALGGALRPAWTGWRIRAPGADFRIAGGLRGTRTVLRAGARVTTWIGLPPTAEVLAAREPPSET